MSKVVYIKEQVVLSNTPSTPDTGFVKLYQKDNGLWYELNSLGVERVMNFDRLAPKIITAPNIVTHNGAANTTTNALTENVILDYDADYLATVSFNFNIDNASSFGKVFATLGGNALDLNDRSADPQGNNQILVTRVRNASNTSGGAITGTGSGNKFNYNMQFFLPGKTVGTESLVIDVGNQTAGVNTSIWNIVAKFEIINLN